MIKYLQINPQLGIEELSEYNEPIWSWNLLSDKEIQAIIDYTTRT